jgi:hypothetical protein
MTHKWSNLNLSGPLQYITGNFFYSDPWMLTSS